MTTVFDSANRSDHTKSLAFFDPAGGVALQRFDLLKYASFDKLTTKTLGFFWQPEEIDLAKDRGDYKTMRPHEKHIFNAVLQRAILLDSVQGRSPNIAFLPIVSLPELEGWIQTWSFNETIHSRSYTHILRNVFSNPSIIFDGIMDITEIVDCAKDVSKHYDRLIELSGYYRLLGEGTHTINGKTVEVDLYDLKKALWMAVTAVNLLEGVRFYAAFAVAFLYAENRLMEGTAQIVKLICRDENIHLGGTQLLLKLLPKDDPAFARIQVETRDECIQLFKDVVAQEQVWIDYVFSTGSLVGLTSSMLKEYVEWIANKRMIAVGLPSSYKSATNPLPWMAKWIAGDNVQVAPQESAITSYVIGGTIQDVGSDTFKGFSL